MIFENFDIHYFDIPIGKFSLYKNTIIFQGKSNNKKNICRIIFFDYFCCNSNTQNVGFWKDIVVLVCEISTPFIQEYYQRFKYAFVEMRAYLFGNTGSRKPHRRILSPLFYLSENRN